MFGQLAPSQQNNSERDVSPPEIGNITDKELFELQRRFVFEHDQRFQQVGRQEIIGLEYVFEELDLITQILSNIERFFESGLKTNAGVLIEGPPGVGKTLCALCLATEANARFIHVPDYPRRTKTGLGAEDFQRLYALSREYVKTEKRAILLFLDDMDAYVSGDSDERKAAVAALNAELSGSRGSPLGVFLVATSNKTNLIPGDLLRPGRIGIRISIDYPTREAKKTLLQHFISRRRSGEIDIESLVFLLKYSMTPPAIEGAVERAWQIAEVRSKTTGTEPVLMQDDLVRVLLRQLRGAPTDITLSDDKILHHARNVSGKALVARTLKIPVQLIALSRHGYNGPHVISEMEDEQEIHELSWEEHYSTVELATLIVDEIFGYTPSGLTTEARAGATIKALGLVEGHGCVEEKLEEPMSAKDRHKPRRLISLPVVCGWRAQRNIPLIGVNDEYVDDYEVAKNLLEKCLASARSILKGFGKDVIDRLAQKLVGSEGTRYLTQRDLDKYIAACNQK